MSFFERDDSPFPLTIGRRSFLIASAAIAGQAVLGSVAKAATSSPLSSDKFMQVSNLLIDHKLDPQTGARMAAGLVAQNPKIGGAIDQILALAKAKNARVVEDFWDDVPEGAVKDAALKIISVWYSGVVEDSHGAEVYAYETALMYQPTHDVMTIPSYAYGKPNSWGANSGAPLENMPVF